MRVLLLLMALTLPRPCAADVGSIGISTALPGTCSVGYMTYLTTGTVGFYVCTSTNTWQSIGSPGGGGIPAGLITLVTSGACASGWSEIAALNGKMLRGTVTANGDVGTSAGSDTITPTVATLTAAAQTFTGSSATSSAVSAGTPAGTNGSVNFTPVGTIAAPVFVGTQAAVPAQTITWPVGVPTAAAITAGTPAGTISALTTGADSSTTGGVAKAIAQTPTFTGSALGTHTHTLSWPAGVPTNATVNFTPAGTIAAPAFTGTQGSVSAQTFTGSALGTHTHTLTATGTNGTSGVTGTMNSFDNRPAYVNVIFCQKN